MKGYLTGYDAHYDRLGSWPDAGALPCTLYRCRHDDVYPGERFIAVHDAFHTLLVGATLDAVKAEIDRRNKSGKW